MESIVRSLVLVLMVAIAAIAAVQTNQSNNETKIELAKLSNIEMLNGKCVVVKPQ